MNNATELAAGRSSGAVLNKAKKEENQPSSLRSEAERLTTLFVYFSNFLAETLLPVDVGDASGSLKKDDILCREKYF